MTRRPAEKVISPARSFNRRFQGRRVLVTGHTGFKGAWLSEWLLALGAEVTGFSLPPPTRPSLFEQLDLRSRMNHLTGDIRDCERVRSVISKTRPDFIFHLAAQPLVRLSYEIPTDTYAVNVMGTVHILDALRTTMHPCTAIFVTTDKCYENREWLHAYREEDSLGGYDPYSSSKAAAEIAISAFRRSFFNPEKQSRVSVASVRAGNVIGGGDWAVDRIIPDAMRSLARGQAIPVRNPKATRPWQHVLEPLSGYLWLASRIDTARRSRTTPGVPFCSAFNFGPPLDSNRPVRDVVNEVLRHWPGAWKDCSDPRAVHEAGLLNLTTDKARHLLGWKPVWNFDDSIAQTVLWYRAAKSSRWAGSRARDFTRSQISAYTANAKKSNLPWA